MAHARKTEKDIRCPLEYGLSVFGGKWKSRIICLLAANGQMRYGALRKEMVNVSDAVLSSALKELAADGIVERLQFEEIPPRVEYLLTQKGAGIVPVLQDICKWAGHYNNEVTDDALPQCKACDYGQRAS